METWLPSTSATLSKAGAMWVSSETGSLSTTEWKGFSSPSSSSCCLATYMSFNVRWPCHNISRNGSRLSSSRSSDSIREVATLCLRPRWSGIAAFRAAALGCFWVQRLPSLHLTAQTSLYFRFCVDECIVGMSACASLSA